MRVKKLIVLQPQLSLTGSGRLLHSMLKQARHGGCGDWDTTVWTEARGELDRRVAETARVECLSPTWANRPGLAVLLAMRFWGNSFHLRSRQRKLRAATRDADLVLVNTVANELALSAIDEQVPVVLYVHELELSVTRLLTPDQMSLWVRRASAVIATSERTAEDLCRWHGLKKERISVVHPWLCQDGDGANMPESSRYPRMQAKSRARVRLGLPEGKRIVLGCGYADWVKGPDLFIDAVCELLREPSAADWQFIWLGRTVDSGMQRLLKGYERHRGVEGRIRWEAETTEPGTWIEAADVLALTSRAESYGMVALEAACRGVPVAYFRQAGGPSEFLAAPLGWGVDELGGVAMAAMLRAAMAAATGREIDLAAAALRARHDERTQVGRLWAELGRHARA